MDMQETYLESLKIRNYEMYKYFKKGLDIISVLKNKTYEAYIVGGAVRDFVLNIDFNDIDIATNATPDAIKEIFSNFEIDDYYANLGSVVLKDSGFRYEITTFRNEEYVKSKIKEVHYSKKLVEDIIRRDYTINALALTPNLTIVDIVEGKKDLENGVIRVIGSGKRRFRDDPSRILRGLHLIAKFNFNLDGNTEKAMRKSKAYLKELSEQKILMYLYKILNEPYGLKALRVIDDNNLFKFIPSFSYWVSLLIRPYKKLDVIEKIALLYRVIGNVVTCSTLSKEEFQRAKKLYELSLNLSTNLVDAPLVFNIGAENLLAADRICKAYNHRYRKQKRIIKKINKKLQIHSIEELDFTMRELIDMLSGNEKVASSIMNQIVSKVVLGEVLNRNHMIKEYAIKLISNPYQPELVSTPKIAKEPIKVRHRIFKKKKYVDDSNFDDSKEEQKLYESIYDEYDDPASTFDAWDQIPVDEAIDDMHTVADESRIQALLNEYNDDFHQLYKIYIRGVNNFDKMNLRDQIIKQEEIKHQVKSFLLRNNEKYRLLDDKGVI